MAKGQGVVTNAGAWMGGINAIGCAAVRGISCGTDRVDVKRGSEPVLAEIANLLENDPSLRLDVVGHIDTNAASGHSMKPSGRGSGRS